MSRKLLRTYATCQCLVRGSIIVFFNKVLPPLCSIFLLSYPSCMPVILPECACLHVPITAHILCAVSIDLPSPSVMCSLPCQVLCSKCGGAGGVWQTLKMNRWRTAGVFQADAHFHLDPVRCNVIIIDVHLAALSYTVCGEKGGKAENQKANERQVTGRSAGNSWHTKIPACVAFRNCSAHAVCSIFESFSLKYFSA